jgi:hypothetical protein
MARGAVSLAHFNLHAVASLAQLTEQEPVHSTVQLAPDSHVTLPLSPTVTSQLEWLPHTMLHECPHVPVQVLWEAHSSEQLGAVPQALEVKSQLAPEAQLQLEPLQLGGGALLPETVPLLPPHA